jgi:hypothetical protein
VNTRLNSRKSGQGLNELFISVKGGSRAVWGGWSVVVVLIQFFGFGSKWDTTG